MSMSVGVIGSGAWGTALAKIIGDNGHRAVIWAREEATVRAINEQHENVRHQPGIKLPDGVTASSELEAVCKGNALLLCIVPSHALRSVAREMGKFVLGDHIIVHGTKGFEQLGCKRMSEVLREETCVRKIGVLSGPNLSREIAAGKPAGTLVASKYNEVVRAAQAVLHGRSFMVFGGNDVVGAEVGGAFKNVVALAAGIIDGLGLGDNTKSLLIARSLNEMSRIGALMGAERPTFWGLSGVGDLVATCASPLSRNHHVGERLAHGETLADILASMVEVAEGVRTTQALALLGRSAKLSLPIVEAVHSVLYEGATVRDALTLLMARPARHEFVEN